MLAEECGRLKSSNENSDFMKEGDFVEQLRYSYLRSTYLLTNLLTYLLTPWSRVLLEKLAGSQLVKKFPAFHGIRKFITAFTTAHHLFISGATPIQAMSSQPTS